VVNATGVVLHTNLGRAPLAPGAVAAVAAAARGYTDLELDLGSGRRGDRLGPVAAKLAALSGAEAGLAVNNNAAAVLLALDTLARGRQAIVSRGELVEIGGSFRVPEILARAGVRLVEVGTTNRTHRADYEAAIGPDTALLLKVHRSNFEQRGFVAEVALPELAALARSRGLPLVEDLGSGTLVRLAGLPAEAFAPDRLRQGADLVCFSGDKLLGGPQAGLVLGRADLVEAMRSNPLARALRLDKLSLAALDWTLTAHLDGRAEREIPVLRQLAATPAALEARAQRLAARLAQVAGAAARIEVVAAPGPVGGGSLPGVSLPGFAVAVETGLGPERLAARLRAAPVPVVGRIHDGRLLLDARTLLDGDDDAVAEAVAAALRDGCRRVEASVRIP
jgi:L-seryl-tRNA(Ser) seleniumtransferase